MTRLLYEKHVPADPLLAAAFADMPPGYGRGGARLARPAGLRRSGDCQDDDSRPRQRRRRRDPARRSPGPRSTEEQRARWVALAAESAARPGLPADPAFRAALAVLPRLGSRQGAEPGAACARTGTGGPPRTASTWPGAERPDSTCRGPAAGPDEAVSFGAHIRPLFRESDRRSMSFAFDLWSAGRRPGACGRHPGTAPERHDALRRRLARGSHRGVPALDADRLPALRASPALRISTAPPRANYAP